MDSITSVTQLLRAQPCPSYIVFDVMVEGAIGAMALSRAQEPDGGYARDLVAFHSEPNLTDIAANRVKILARVVFGGAESLRIHTAAVF